MSRSKLSRLNNSLINSNKKNKEKYKRGSLSLKHISVNTDESQKKSL